MKQELPRFGVGSWLKTHGFFSLFHRIHVWYVYLHLPYKSHVGKYTSPMDPMGFACLVGDFFSWFYHGKSPCFTTIWEYLLYFFPTTKQANPSFCVGTGIPDSIKPMNHSSQVVVFCFCRCRYYKFYEVKDRTFVDSQFHGYTPRSWNVLPSHQAPFFRGEKLLGFRSSPPPDRCFNYKPLWRWWIHLECWHVPCFAGVKVNLLSIAQAML